MPLSCGALSLPQFPWLVAGRFSAARVIRSQTEASSDSQFVNYGLGRDSGCRERARQPRTVRCSETGLCKTAAVWPRSENWTEPSKTPQPEPSLKTQSSQPVPLVKAFGRSMSFRVGVPVVKAGTQTKNVGNVFEKGLIRPV